MRARSLLVAAWSAGALILASCPGRSQPVAGAVVNGAIDRPLTEVAGDPARGRDVARDPRNASCLICHHMPIPEEPNHGNIGPDLAGVGARYSAGQLRLRLVDPKLIDPATVMPAYYSLRNLHDVQAQFRDKTIYSAQDIEDVVAYLQTLRSP